MGRWKEQTRAEFQKNYTRVKDIVSKSDGNVEKAISLSKTQANRITNEYKAINRAMSAKETYYSTNDDMYMEIFEVFFKRAYDLGSVSTQDYRDYQLEKLGI
jgi:hypothetical protein